MPYSKMSLRQRVSSFLDSQKEADKSNAELANLFLKKYSSENYKLTSVRGYLYELTKNSKRKFGKKAAAVPADTPANASVPVTTPIETEETTAAVPTPSTLKMINDLVEATKTQASLISTLMDKLDKLPPPPKMAIVPPPPKMAIVPPKMVIVPPPPKMVVVPPPPKMVIVPPPPKMAIVPPPQNMAALSGEKIADTLLALNVKVSDFLVNFLKSSLPSTASEDELPELIRLKLNELGFFQKIYNNSSPNYEDWDEGTLATYCMNVLGITPRKGSHGSKRYQYYVEKYQEAMENDQKNDVSLWSLKKLLEVYQELKLEEPPQNMKKKNRREYLITYLQYYNNYNNSVLV